MQVSVFGTHFPNPTNSKISKAFSIEWSFPVVEPEGWPLVFVYWSFFTVSPLNFQYVLTLSLCGQVHRTLMCKPAQWW